MSGVACAQALRERGVTVDIVERGRAPGGRMAAPTVQGRRVDLGAAYFTVKDGDFAGVVDDWTGRGLARPWTDTFDVLTPDGRDTSSGPVRFAAPGGLRSLVRDLLPTDGIGDDARVGIRDDARVGIRYGAPVGSLDELTHDAVVLAMPDPQAARLAPDACDWVSYEPVIAVAAGWSHRSWTVADAAFVNDDPDVSFIADDGARRGDGAAVLVAHSTAARAQRHLERPDDAIGPVLAAVRRLLAITDEPSWTHVHRWTFAKPAGTHGDAPFALLTSTRPLGVCGDAWSPTGAPRVESAWMSGRRLGAALADHVAGEEKR